MITQFLTTIRVRLLTLLGIPGVSLKVRGEYETLDWLATHAGSIARYGDGELLLMLGRGIPFQEFDPVLAQRLRTILGKSNERFIVGIPNFDKLAVTSANKLKMWQKDRIRFSHFVTRGLPYFSMYISRPRGIVGLESAAYYERMRQLWTDRTVVLVSNQAAANEHSVYANARQVHLVRCPAQHAFREYSQLLRACEVHLQNDAAPLFLLSAGPTATLLAWDLSERGAQALDIGHLPACYTQFLRDSAA